MTSEERFIELTAQIMTDDTPLPVVIQIKEAWMLISGLQLATRHPDLSPMMVNTLKNIARQFQAAIVELHPQAQALLDMGWDERFDVDKKDGPGVNAPPLPTKLKPVNNCWTIYAEGATQKNPAMAVIGRPQDWGDPKWMYRVYVLEGQGYRNTVHCWIDQQFNEHEHLETFAPLVAQIMLPGWPVEWSGRDYLREDDFWRKEWGEMPPDFETDGDFNY